MDKLLKQAHKARVNELGKVAALQFESYLEKHLHEAQDFSVSVRRIYTRQSLISALRPMLLLV